MDNISILIKVPVAVNAIDAGTVNPIVDTSVGPIILLNTSNKELGNLIWTYFDRETFFPLSSWTARYGAAQTLQQVLFEPYPSRMELTKIVDQVLPGSPWVDCLPMIVPGCSITYPTAVTQPAKKRRKSTKKG